MRVKGSRTHAQIRMGQASEAFGRGEPLKKHRIIGTKTYIVLDNLVLAASLHRAAVHDYDMQS